VRCVPNSLPYRVLPPRRQFVDDLDARRARVEPGTGVAPELDGHGPRRRKGLGAHRDVRPADGAVGDGPTPAASGPQQPASNASVVELVVARLNDGHRIRSVKALRAYGALVVSTPRAVRVLDTTMRGPRRRRRRRRGRRLPVAGNRHVSQRPGERQRRMGPRPVVNAFVILHAVH
jgi:hypothetical protein